MKIAIVHNSYREAGGEDAVVRREMDLLMRNGQEVVRFEVSSKTIGSGLISQIEVAKNLSYSVASRKQMSEFLTKESPNIVHVHNWFPLLTPSVYDACEDHGIPVVQTLHNYRTTCSNALLLRNGKPCELCVQGSPYLGVVHACYRDSRVATFPVARMIDFHRSRGTWNTKVARFIALTEFSRNIFVRSGFDPTKIIVKPNFADDPSKEMSQFSKEEPSSEPFALFVGRLSPEKGLKTLLDAWQSIDFPLKIIGTGPLKDKLMSSVPTKEVSFLGDQPSMQVSQAMQEASFLVMPSECYETFGMVLVEAFSHGLPVIVSDLGSPCELVENEVTGLHFKSGDSRSLGEAVRRLSGDRALLRALGIRARKEYLEKYTPERNFEMLQEVYTKAIAGNAATG